MLKIMPRFILSDAWLFGSLTLLLVSVASYADEDPSLVRPDKGQFEPQESSVPPQKYAVPDAPPYWKEKLSIKNDAFTMQLSLISVLDYTAFSQDDTNLRQVGRMDDEFDVRAMRLIARGSIGQDRKLKYFAATEFEGFDPAHTNVFSLVDAYLSYPFFGPQAQISVGKMKETFAYEMVGDSANLAQQERILNPFFVSRNVGVKLSGVGPDERMTAAIGAFNDSWVTGGLDGSATDYTGRVTGILGDPRSADYLHLGAAVRRVGAGDDALRLRGRPETNVGANFVDTGTFNANHAWNYGLEALWNKGPFSLLFEQVWSVVDAGGSGDPVFAGNYLTASWFLTGDYRPYDPTVGYARRVQPQHQWGALELVARISQLDLEDGDIHGGEMKRVFVGMNWWATQRWRVGVGWGHTWLDRDGKSGESDSILTRLQWVF